MCVYVCVWAAAQIHFEIENHCRLDERNFRTPSQWESSFGNNQTTVILKHDFSDQVWSFDKIVVSCYISKDDDNIRVSAKRFN